MYVYIYVYIYNLFVAVLGLCCCTGLFLVRVHWLLIATASLVDEHKPYSTGSVVVVHGMWDFSRSGIKPPSPALAGRFFYH